MTWLQGSLEAAEDNLRAADIAHGLKGADDAEPRARRDVVTRAMCSCLPRTLCVVSTPFWEPAWRAFHPEHTSLRAPVNVHSFQAAWGDAPHRANRIALDIVGEPHDRLLVRLMHPAGRSKIGSARWLLARQTFRELAQQGA